MEDLGRIEKLGRIRDIKTILMTHQLVGCNLLYLASHSELQLGIKKFLLGKNLRGQGGLNRRNVKS